MHPVRTYTLLGGLGVLIPEFIEGGRILFGGGGTDCGLLMKALH